MSEDPARPWLLAIDTATDQAGIAMFDGQNLAEHSWPGGRQQTTTVLPAVEYLCARVGIGLDEVGAVAVAIGPGSFTGLRVGLGLAKGVVLANDCALIGVPTLEIAAAPWQVAGVPSLVVVPAGRNRVLWAHLTASGLSEPQNTDVESFLDQVGSNPGCLVAGELSPPHRNQVLAIGGNLAPTALGYRRPGTLAEIAWERWQRGDLDDPVLLEPTYLHGRPNPR